MPSTSGPWHHHYDPSQFSKCQRCGQVDRLNSDSICKWCVKELNRRSRYNYKGQEKKLS